MHAFLYLFIYYRLFTGVILRKLNWAHFRREKKIFTLIRESFALIREIFVLIRESYALIREKYIFSL